MKTVLKLIVVLTSTIVFAQTSELSAPDLSQIETNIQDKNSDFYYEKLLQRFEKADSTMTLDEKRHLYYGYGFQKNYSPYHRLNDVLDEINKIFENQNLSDEQARLLIYTFG